MDNYKIKLIKEKLNYYDGRRISSPKEASGILKEFIGNEPRENFVVLCLNTKNRITGIHTVSVGTLNSSLVHPREVFQAALLSNSAGVIVGHNHPSGDVKPSREDLKVTSRLKEAGEILGIDLLDHLIVGDDIYSFAEENQL